MKIYLAGPLFSEAERDWLRNLKKDIEELVESQGKLVNIIWPSKLATLSEIDQLGEKAKFEFESL
jgi:nucleoside 2-deoxyribosyltransferase